MADLVPPTAQPATVAPARSSQPWPIIGKAWITPRGTDAKVREQCETLLKNIFALTGKNGFWVKIGNQPKGQEQVGSLTLKAGDRLYVGLNDKQGIVARQELNLKLPR